MRAPTVAVAGDSITTLLVIALLCGCASGTAKCDERMRLKVGSAVFSLLQIRSQEPASAQSRALDNVIVSLYGVMCPKTPPLTDIAKVFVPECQKHAYSVSCEGYLADIRFAPPNCRL